MERSNTSADPDLATLPFSQSWPTCPGCRGQLSLKILNLAQVPVNCSALWPTKDSARLCQKGRIELRTCKDCGLVFNGLFDAQKLEYNTQYDNALDFSSAFRGYAEKLAGELARIYGLSRKRIVEIGCGNGSFLQLLCAKGNNTGIGFDPSFPGNETTKQGVRFVRGYFGAAEAAEGFDFLCCRHVLEHIEHPLEFLHRLGDMSRSSPQATFYFEVPNGEFVLRREGLWDIIYPHVSYFTEASLGSLFERAGFRVLRKGIGFSGQFLFIEAELSGSSGVKRSGRDSAPTEGASYFWDQLQPEFEDSLARWSACLAQLASNSGGAVAFWGAGAKGVSFLNLVPGASEIGMVVDSNPRKQGRFVPGTGQEIWAPAKLAKFSPGTVVLLNSAYRSEIRDLLDAQGISAPIVSCPKALHRTAT